MDPHRQKYYIGETIGRIRRYWDEGHTPSLQGSLLIFLATADGEAFLFISILGCRHAR
jgi:hypothetical protein